MSKGKRRAPPGPQAKGPKWKGMHGKRSTPPDVRLGPSHMTPECMCPACGGPINRATPIGTRPAPVPGAWSVCCHCAVVLRYTEELQLRLPTREEFETMRKEQPKLAADLNRGSAAVILMRRDVGPSKAHPGGHA